MKALSVMIALFMAGIAGLGGFFLYRHMEAKHSRELNKKEQQVSHLRAMLDQYKSVAADLKEQVHDRNRDLELSRKEAEALLSAEPVIEGTEHRARIERICKAFSEEFREQISRKEAEVKGTDEDLSVVFVNKLLFDFAKTSISSEGREILDRAGSILSREEGNIRIIGMADNVPIAPQYRSIYPSNWELSAARAASVATYLQEEVPIDPSRMEVVGYSYYRPVTSNETEQGRAQNRRVEIRMIPKAAG